MRPRCCPAPGDEALIHDGMRAHFERDVEVFVLPAPAPESAPEPAPDAAPASASPDTSPASLAPSFFDDFYARHDDPWGFDTRWYEERKRALVLATLPRQRFRDVLELGCATGALTVALRGRADRVLGVDASETALERARRRIAEDDPGSIELRRATLPGEWPDGEYELVVMSEIGYYWSPSDLHDAARKSLATLSADGVLVACHWRHPVEEYPGTAEEVHAVLRALPGLRLLARHEEEDFLLDVLVRENEPSIARAAGITP
jgi:SAM-dependent methyltransferase